MSGDCEARWPVTEAYGPLTSTRARTYCGSARREAMQ